MKILVFHTIMRVFVSIPCEIQPKFTNDINVAHDFKSIRKANEFVVNNLLTQLVIFELVDLTK